MTPSWGAADFDYGNTRLRARRSELLRASDYEALLGKSVDELLASLRGGDRPGPSVASVPGGTGLPSGTDSQRLGGLNGLHVTIRTRLGRSLEEMRSFYSGKARRLVDALLSRFDLQNVIAVLRARSRPGITAEEAVAALVPMGWLREPVAREILRAQQLPGLVDMLAELTPDDGQASVLRQASAAHERTGDFAGLERAVFAEHAVRVADRLRGTGPAGAALRELMQMETDRHNILVVLRLREAVLAGADDTPPPKEALLAGGALSTAALTSLVTVPAGAAVGDLVAGQLPAQWKPALQQWSTSGDLSELEGSMERHTMVLAAGLFVGGDPLAIDVPVAFTVATQVEARNLRLLGGAAAGALAPKRLRDELLLVGSST